MVSDRGEGGSFQKMCVCARKLTAAVCLTWYGDAIAVRIGNQEPLLKFADANAVGP